ncbi:MAG: CPBP family intramembrane metalloprotease [Enterococcus faecium]|nr:CPBP family intramembrane metalloprotease [Enterococcus faecium]
MKIDHMRLTLIKSIILTVWITIFCITNFGIIRSKTILILLENNQLGLNLIMILFIYLLCMSELNRALQGLNLSMMKQVGFTLLLLLVTNFIYMVLVFGSFEVVSQNYDSIVLFSVIVIAPIKEELIYRYLFLSITDSNWLKLVYGLVSTGFFFYGHSFTYGGNLFAMVQVLFLTLATIYLYVKTNNILPAMMLHSLYNLFVLSLSMAQ